MSLARRIGRSVGLEVYKPGSLWEAVESEAVARFLRDFSIDCVFDVGANVGQYASRLRELGFAGHILSFEPNPSLIASLETASAKDDRWRIYPTALDSETREMSFNVMKRNTFSSLHAPDHSGTGLFREMNDIEQVVTIKTETLNDVFPSLRNELGFRRPFLKMDTQGHDLAVVQGGSAVMTDFVGLQSELAIVRLYQDSPVYTESIAEYQRLGFRLTAMFPNNAGHFPDLNELDCLMYNPGMRMQ